MGGLTDDEAFFAARGFGVKIGFGKRPAVLVIDLTKGFTDAQRPLGADLSSQITVANEIITSAKNKEVPVIFTAVRYDNPNLIDAGIWAMKQKGVASLLASGDGHELDERLSANEQDIRLYKKYASCFWGTDLLSMLINLNVDTVIMVGTSTSGCVRATAVDACQAGFRPMVVEEGVGDRSEASHRQSLFDLNAKYADVVSLRETLDYLSGLPTPSVPRV
ncbi:isochorismatase family protein [Pusillimonas minor]|uniref:Isochorismatase family protein n=1 Tax=Pusillimonas minor TaxID=2697024 RepID=A0A842HQ59_9BURK|nr:isochorismatase family protein [Pusillimonas minor]MBC2769005.1 isochorismatase family protein [Pusillimonas minor]